MKKLVLIFGVLLVSCLSAMSQTRTELMGNGSTTINCNETITFYDDGGSSGKHAKGVHYRYTITSPLGTKIRITFSSLGFGGTGTYLRLHNGPTDASSYTSITSQTQTFVSDSNVVLANFYSPTPTGWGYNAGSGWVATIEVEECPSSLGSVALACGSDAITIGGNAIDASATAYTENQFCVRTYTSNFGSKLFLTFTDLPDDGSNDWVAVYDGAGMGSPLIGQYKASSSLASVTSTTNALTIAFKSNSSVNGSWAATLQPDLCIDDLGDVDLECNDTRVLGGEYTANTFTSQTFTANNINAQVLLDLSVLPHDDANDYVEVYDGSGATATLIGQYFGYGAPSTIASTGNVMTVVFHSNATNHGNWSGVVSVDCPDTVNMPGYREAPDTIETCNAVIYDNGGPNGNYANNLDGEYLVLRPGRSGCVLHLEGEYEFQWYDDYITIYDGEGTSGEVLWGGGCHGHGKPRQVYGASCGSDPGVGTGDYEGKGYDYNHNACVTFYPKVTSKTGALTIRFHTNNATACSGFEFHATCLPKPTDCYNTGVVIFTRGDYGGNSPSDPVYVSTAASPYANVCSYTYRPSGMTSNGGTYAIRKYACDQYQYFNYIDDHTHPGDITRGYLFNIDASSDTTKHFYKDSIHLDCDGVDKLLVSFWVANINNEQHEASHYPNLRVGFFRDQNCTQPLCDEIETGPVPEMQMYGCFSDANDWQYYSLELSAIPDGQREIWFRIRNKANTDNGNDFVLDDVEVRACLPPSVLTRISSSGQTIYSSANVCAGDTLVLRGDLDYSLGAQSTYTTPYYLWQRGVNSDPNDPNSSIVWEDMEFVSGRWMYNGVRVAYTNTPDWYYVDSTDNNGNIVYDAAGNPIKVKAQDRDNVDGYENYSQITIFEPPSATEPTYTHHYYRIIIAGTVGALTSRYCHSASDPYVITVTRIPEITFGGTNAICEGGTINLSVTGNSPTPGTWSIDSENGNADPASFHANLYQDASGYHVSGALHDEITIKYMTSPENGSCWNTKTIPIYTMPVITITPETTTICEGSDITLHPSSDQESSFQWEGTGAPGCSAASWATDNTCADWTVNPLVTTTYTVDVSTVHSELDDLGNPLTCRDTARKVVTVLPKPGDIVVDGAPTSPVCPGTVLTFIPSATGAGTLTYSWDGTDYYTAAEAGSTYTVTATTPGTSTYTLYIKDNRTEGGVDYSCPATHDVVVEVYNNPSLAISTPVGINCFGQNTGSFILTGSSPGTSIPFGSGSSAYYEFSKDDGDTYTHATTGNMLQYTFSDLYSGTYHVAIRDGHNCVFKQDVEVPETQLAALTAQITDANTIPTCQGQSVGALTVTADHGTPGTSPDPAYTYAWNTGATTAGITDLPAATYTVEVTDAHGCTATASKEITSREVPSINVSTNAAAVCASSPSATLNIMNNNSLEIASHSWSVNETTGAGLPANLNTESLAVEPSGTSTTAPTTYVYTDVVTAQNGCVVSGDVVLTVNPTAILNNTSGDLDQTLCFEKTLTPIVFEYSGGATGVTLTWTDETPATTCLDYVIDNTAHTLTISEGSTPVAGTYAYTVQTTGAISPCDNPPYSGTIIIRPELTVTVSGDHQSCVTGDIGVATANPVGGKPFGTAPDTYYEYSWNTTPARTTQTIDNLPGGTYNVVVTDANNCTATNTVTLVENTNPVVMINDVETICPNAGTATVTAEITTATAPGYIYTWTDDSPFVVTSANPTAATTATSVTATVHVPNAEETSCSETYTLRLQVEDANNCLSEQVSKVITVEDVTPPELIDPTSWPADISNLNYCFVNADTTGLLNDNEIAALFRDNCSRAVIVTHVDAADPNSNACQWSWTRTYTIKDSCNVIYCTSGTTLPTMTVSGGDQSAPELIDPVSWPANITGQNNCFANADISELYSDDAIKALFSDCSQITVEHSDANTSTDDCNWTITRTYTIKDSCNHVYKLAGDVLPTMSVSGKDQNPPEYVLPATLTVYKTDACTYTVDTAVTHSVPTMLTDDCSAPEDLTLTYTDSNVIVAACTDTIKRTWRLVDVCGNVSILDSVQTILITDTIKPTITRNYDTYPALGVGSCQYQVPNLTGFVTVDDNCTDVADLVITQDPLAGTPSSTARRFIWLLANANPRRFSAQLKKSIHTPLLRSPT